MKVKPEQLASHLKRTLAGLYLVGGDEPLQLEEACDALRNEARRKGYSERTVLTVGADFNWSALLRVSQSLSLFAERRLIELRLTSGKPGADGAAALIAYAARPAPDTLLLIISPRIDTKAQASKWFKALEQTGVIVPVWPVELSRMPQWVDGRMRAKGMQPTKEAIQLLAERVEGNLLAAVQDIEKLYLLYGPTLIDADAVIRVVADSARFDIYGLVDTALAGESLRAGRILHGLRGEGVDPVLVLWAWQREIRSLAAMAYDCSRGITLERVLADHHVWDKRKAYVREALQRHRPSQWRQLLRLAARIDRVNKGISPGNSWDELLQLSLLVAGMRLFKRQGSSYEC